MPDIRFKCPHCQQQLEAPADLFGQNVSCPSCQSELHVPTPPTPLELRFACPNCGQHLEAPADMSGSAVNCPSCNVLLEVPCITTDSEVVAPQDPDAEGGKRKARITLTKAQLTDPNAQDLLGLLKEITDDGELALGEIQKLSAWLANAEASRDLPAVAFLSAEVKRIVEDGCISLHERFDLLDAIERVLPLPDRRAAKSKRDQAESLTQKTPAYIDDFSAATDRQLAYIAALGGDPDSVKTKDQASELIDTLKSKATASPRQMMVLRFWDRLDLATRSREAISTWMDQWYNEDPRRLRAWETFKTDTGDNGFERNASRVPIGEGFRYLDIV